jgi:LysR family transcriptional activator of nhaA
MHRLNYNHLLYFYTVAKEGSIAKASEQLCLAPQTISGQISAFEKQIGFKLFERDGKRLRPSELGQHIMQYAEDIFSLGEELKRIIDKQQPIQQHSFHVGVTDVIPKALAFQLIAPVLDLNQSIRIICSEGDQQTLLAELAINRLDMIITDQALIPGGQVRATCHKLAQSDYCFYAAPSIVRSQKPFPQNLGEYPWLLPGKKSSVRQSLLNWFDHHQIIPKIVGEFDDSALLKSFAQAGYGAFAGPNLIERHICQQYGVSVIGRTTDIQEVYYAILPSRRINHPATEKVMQGNN